MNLEKTRISRRIPSARFTLVVLLVPLLSCARTADEVDRVAAVDHAVILQYHHVDTATPRITSVTPVEFSAQLRLIQEHALVVEPLTTVVEKIRTGQPLRDKTLAITFDDGYVSVHREAFPRLRELGWPFTIFVQTDTVGRPGYVTWDELREMHAHGASIANHSRTHAHLIRRLEGESATQWLTRVTEEIESAEKTLAREIGESLRYHAYPYGEYNDALKAWLRQHDYIGFGQQSGAVGPLADFAALPRFPIAGSFTVLDEFLLKSQSLPLPVLDQSSLPDPALPEQVTHPALEITLASGAYAIDQLACYASGQGAMQVEFFDELHFRMTPNDPLPPGRSRYNCTAPHRGSGRYYWFSYQWVRPGGSD